MSTTELFVELVVIGAGAFIWISLLIFSLFGYDWIPWQSISSVISLIPSLAIIYVLGITVDKVVDRLFSKWDKKLRKDYFLTNEDYHRARTYVYTYAADKIVNLFEYGRSRIRITRSWSINSLFLMISVPLFVLTQFMGRLTQVMMLVILASIVVFLMLSYLLLFSWRKLAENDYKRLSETFLFSKDEGTSLLFAPL